MTKISDIALPRGGPYHGQTAVTTPGTEVPLGPSQALKSGVNIKALTTNTGLIFVGANPVTSTTGFQLAAGDSVFLEIDNLSRIWIDSAAAAEGVSYIGT